MLIGLCGAQGSGKTTAAQYLCGASTVLSKPQSISPIKYVTEQLKISETQITYLMQEWVDPDWSWNWCSHCIANSDNGHSHSRKWRAVSLADPLKRVCAVLFNYPYHVLLGETPETREIRERLTTYQYSVCGALTGRQLLQYFGTEVIRNNLGGTFWADIAENDIYQSLQDGTNIVIPDVRFPDEAQMIKFLSGKLILIDRPIHTASKNASENASENANLHASESFYLTLEHDAVICNDGSLTELRAKLDSTLRSFNETH